MLTTVRQEHGFTSVDGTEGGRGARLARSMMTVITGKALDIPVVYFGESMGVLTDKPWSSRGKEGELSERRRRSESKGKKEMRESRGQIGMATEFAAGWLC